MHHFRASQAHFETAVATFAAPDRSELDSDEDDGIVAHTSKTSHIVRIETKVAPAESASSAPEGPSASSFADHLRG